MDNKEAAVDPSVRACGELFELLKEICGGSQEGAAEVWKRAFWFKFDGRNPIVIPDTQAAEFAGWVVGATMLMKGLTASGFFQKVAYAGCYRRSEWAGRLFAWPISVRSSISVRVPLRISLLAEPSLLLDVNSAQYL